MARITVEDCLEHIPNRFDLVLIASKRARQLAHGREPTLPWDNDKPTVLALREIAAGTIDASVLDEQPVKEHAEEALAGAVSEEGAAGEAGATMGDLERELQEEFRQQLQAAQQGETAGEESAGQASQAQEPRDQESGDQAQEQEQG